MSEILNKKALVEVVAEKLEMTKKDATVAVDTVFEEITKTLADGGSTVLLIGPPGANLCGGASRRLCFADHQILRWLC